MLTLQIPEEMVEAIFEQARAAAPVEACGILAGRGQTVEKLYRMTNVEQSCEHFMMAPAEQFQVAKDIRAAGLRMLAIYHSHPETPARPSEEDIRLGLTPDVVHLIVSLQDPDNPSVRAFKIREDDITEVEVGIASGGLQRNSDACAHGA